MKIEYQPPSFDNPASLNLPPPLQVNAYKLKGNFLTASGQTINLPGGDKVSDQEAIVSGGMSVLIQEESDKPVKIGQLEGNAALKLDPDYVSWGEFFMKRVGFTPDEPEEEGQGDKAPVPDEFFTIAKLSPLFPELNAPRLRRLFRTGAIEAKRVPDHGRFIWQATFSAVSAYVDKINLRDLVRQRRKSPQREEVLVDFSLEESIPVEMIEGKPVYTISFRERPGILELEDWELLRHELEKVSLYGDEYAYSSFRPKHFQRVLKTGTVYLPKNPSYGEIFCCVISQNPKDPPGIRDSSDQDFVEILRDHIGESPVATFAIYKREKLDETIIPDTFAFKNPQDKQDALVAVIKINDYWG